jgi:hypothetical protein
MQKKRGDAVQEGKYCSNTFKIRIVMYPPGTDKCMRRSGAMLRYSEQVRKKTIFKIRSEQCSRMF